MTPFLEVLRGFDEGHKEAVRDEDRYQAREAVMQSRIARGIRVQKGWEEGLRSIAEQCSAAQTSVLAVLASRRLEEERERRRQRWRQSTPLHTAASAPAEVAAVAAPPIEEVHAPNDDLVDLGADTRSRDSAVQALARQRLAEADERLRMAAVMVQLKEQRRDCLREAAAQRSRFVAAFRARFGVGWESGGAEEDPGLPLAEAMPPCVRSGRFHFHPPRPTAAAEPTAIPLTLSAAQDTGACPLLAECDALAAAGAAPAAVEKPTECPPLPVCDMSDRGTEFDDLMRETVWCRRLYRAQLMRPLIPRVSVVPASDGPLLADGVN